MASERAVQPRGAGGARLRRGHDADSGGRDRRGIRRSPAALFQRADRRARRDRGDGKLPRPLQPRLPSRVAARVPRPLAGGRGALKMIAIKRVYEPPSAADGTRFLVERLWPRGMRKDALPLDSWLKDAGPTTALRRWFGH